MHRALWDDQSCRDCAARLAPAVPGAELPCERTLHSRTQGICSWLKALLKGISLVCLAALFAVPDCMVASDAWLLTERCMSLSCPVSSSLDLKSLAWVGKDVFCILEGLRPLQIQDQMLMQR